MSFPIKINRRQLLTRRDDIPWMDTMVLNPALIEQNGTLHMLFRATGTNGGDPAGPLPYPICLGYGKSTDGGKTWEFDTSRPALMPKGETDPEKLYITDIHGKKAVNYANGCIEDPRLFRLNGTCYMTVACRLFAPGAYWVHDCPTQCAPPWALKPNPFGRAANENLTVTVLYRVDLDALNSHDYENAFAYVTNLTDPNRGDNRDVILFPEQMQIDGKLCYVLLERPSRPDQYPGISAQKPSIVITAAERLEDFAVSARRRRLFAAPQFAWESSRIGASGPLLKADDSHWLLGYHGKQDEQHGYTQSFMLLENRENDFPAIISRKDEEMIRVAEDWEMPGRFPSPCIFITGMLRLGSRLVLSYGAADERVGIMDLDFDELLAYLRS